MMTYQASKDNTVKIVTVLVIVLFAFIAQQNVRDLITATDLTTVIINCAVILFLIAIILVCYLLSPRLYQLDEATLTINKTVKSRQILLSEISDVKSITKEDLKSTYRTFGVGGLFGYYGKFRNHQLGAMTWYATQNKNHMLLVLRSGEKIVLTPDDMQLENVLKNKMV